MQLGDLLSDVRLQDGGDPALADCAGVVAGTPVIEAEDAARLQSVLLKLADGLEKLKDQAAKYRRFERQRMSF